MEPVIRSARRRGLGIVAAGVTAALTLTACGGSQEEPGGPTGEGASEGSIGVGLVLAGPRNDRAFYQAYYDGVMALADEYDLDVSVVDNITDSQAAVDAFMNLAADNELVIAGGVALTAPGSTIAEQFPDTKFAMAGLVDDGVANLHTYATRQGVPAYVAGVLAAELTESGVIGFVGGADIPPNAESLIDWEAGAKSVDPSIQVVSATVGSFGDAARAREATAAQIANGADVIYAFQDAGLPGVLDAIEEAGTSVPVFNPTTDRCEESEHLAGYAYQNTQAMVGHILTDFINGEMPSEHRLYALEDPDVQALHLCPGFAEHEDLVTETTAAINDGTITLPEGG